MLVLEPEGRAYPGQESCRALLMAAAVRRQQTSGPLPGPLVEILELWGRMAWTPVWGSCCGLRGDGARCILCGVEESPG